MEQLESRALGKPKETVAHEAEESEAQKRMRSMTTEELEQAFQSRRHLRPVEDEAAEAHETVQAGN
jgi:hypothetical protein